MNCKNSDITFEILPIGKVTSTRVVAEDDNWDSETSAIELVPTFGERSLMGLATFSHCIVVYVFDKAQWDESRMSRHPRGNKDWPEVGIFAQRGKDGPNRLGVTVCRVIGVEDHILRVDDLAGTRAELLAKGVQATELGEHSGVETFAFPDNEGRWFAVIGA